MSKDLKIKHFVIYYSDLDSLIKDCEALKKSTDFSNLLLNKPHTEDTSDENVISSYRGVREYDPNLAIQGYHRFALNLEVEMPKGVMFKFEHNNKDSTRYFYKDKIKKGSLKFIEGTAKIKPKLFRVGAKLEESISNEEEVNGLTKILKFCGDLRKKLLKIGEYKIAGEKKYEKEIVTLNYRFTDHKIPHKLYQKIKEKDFAALLTEEFAGKLNNKNEHRNIVIGESVKQNNSWVQIKLKMPKGIVKGQNIKNISNTMPIKILSGGFKIIDHKKILSKNLKSNEKKLKKLKKMLGKLEKELEKLEKKLGQQERSFLLPETPEIKKIKDDCKKVLNKCAKIRKEIANKSDEIKKEKEFLKNNVSSRTKSYAPSWATRIFTKNKESKTSRKTMKP